MSKRHRAWRAAALASLLVGCGVEGDPGARVSVTLHVAGGPSATYAFRVLRADGVSVAEATAHQASGSISGDLPCDPSLDAQPNTLAISIDRSTRTGPVGSAASVLGDPPAALSLPFACDAASVRLQHELLVATSSDQAESLVLGTARCGVVHRHVEPRFGAPWRVHADFTCEGPPGAALDVGPMTLTCGDVVVAPGAPRVDGRVGEALPFADLNVAVAPLRLSVELEPLATVGCSLDVPIIARERAIPGTRPVVMWRVDVEGAATSVGYPPHDAPPALTPPTAVAVTAFADGATLEVVLTLPPTLRRPRYPASGLSLAVTTDDGVHRWSIFVAPGEAVALRDSAPASVVAEMGDAGGIRLRLPAGPGAFAVAPLLHTDGALLPRAFTGTMPAEATAEPTPLSVATVTAGTLLMLSSPPNPKLGTPVRVDGLFLAPLEAQAGSRPLELGQAPTALALSWPDSTVALTARWAPLDPGLCATLGVCPSIADWPQLGADRVAPPLPFAALHEGDDPDVVLIARLLDGDPSLGPAPLQLDSARIVAFATGRATCVAARDPKRDVTHIIAGRADGASLRFDRPGVDGDRWGCVVGSHTLSAVVATGEAATATLGPDALHVATSPAGATVARVVTTPLLVAATYDEGELDVVVVVAGLDAENPQLQVDAAAFDLTPNPDGSWRASLLPDTPSGLVAVAAGGQTTQHIWLALPGSDTDGDGVDDYVDVCPRVHDPDQEDTDRDGVGDACDPDRDGDGWANVVDRCPDDFDPGQEDADGDGVGDLCDACPDDPTEQHDTDGDGQCDNAQLAACGDGVVDGSSGEQCDDGGRVDGDGCDAYCRLPCGADEDAIAAIHDARTGRCFLLLPGRADFDVALERCEAVGGHVAIPDDAIENAAVYVLANYPLPPISADGPWLGVTDREVEERFVTLTGARPAFQPWGPNEPTSHHSRTPGDHREDESCVAMFQAAPLWHDTKCDAVRPVVCERALEHCGDGVIQRSLGEACDPGNTVAGDDCGDDCQWLPPP